MSIVAAGQKVLSPQEDLSTGAWSAWAFLVFKLGGVEHVLPVFVVLPRSADMNLHGNSTPRVSFSFRHLNLS